MSDFIVLTGTARFVLVITTDGHGKRVPVTDIPLTRNGRDGVRLSFEPLAGAAVVTEHDDVLVATRAGRTIRVAAADVPVMGRRARGARLARLHDGDTVTAMAKAPKTPSQLHRGVASRHATPDPDPDTVDPMRAVSRRQVTS